MSKLTKSIPYYDSSPLADHDRCRYDLYQPDNAKDCPAIVWFHGGGLEGGTPDWNIPFAQTMASLGVVVANCMYRLSPEVAYPTHNQDAAAAFAHVHRSAAPYGVNPKRVFIAGHSAGGYLAAIVASDARYLQAHGLSLSDVAGSIPVSAQTVTHHQIRAERGMHNYVPVIDEAAPSWYVSAKLPPFLLICADGDMPCRIEENQLFIAALGQNGHTDNAFHVIEGRDHGSVMDKAVAVGDPAFDLMMNFVKQH